MLCAPNSCGRTVVVASLLALAACSTSDVASSSHGETFAPAGACPQPRATARAPDSYLSRVNPLPATPENIERGRRFYAHDVKPEPCANCHGAKGDGRGDAGAGLSPSPRNFTCTATMSGIPDGQLYWVIEHGSGDYHLPARQGAQQLERPGRGVPFTAMRGYGNDLTPTEIWQLVLYLRALGADPREAAQP